MWLADRTDMVRLGLIWLVAVFIGVFYGEDKQNHAKPAESALEGPGPDDYGWKAPTPPPAPPRISEWDLHDGGMYPNPPPPSRDRSADYRLAWPTKVEGPTKMEPNNHESSTR